MLCVFVDFDLEIRKRYAQPLAVESGEFPDTTNIEARMLSFCYETGLVSGHVPEAVQLMSVATETFIKEVISTVFSRTRANPPGESGNAGLGPNNGWIQTYKYKRQLAREEEAFARGEVQRDKSGLLPVEAKAAGERDPLGMADLGIALQMGDCGMAGFPVIARSVLYSYREGELEDWEDYTWLDGRGRPSFRKSDGAAVAATADVGAAAGEKEKMDALQIKAQKSLPNGVVDHGGDPMDVDDGLNWEGADPSDGDFLNGVLDSCLAVG
ncbi:hypothetical protein VTK73DRAFT_9938 [Phialemonium thermophilum]|uniref:Transcription initiation factor TFIID subunit 8 n=1 Tax=Phialemonium thermophilum TaxID=223376 RepID=A0ABR3VZA6_9PEZI